MQILLSKRKEKEKKIHPAGFTNPKLSASTLIIACWFNNVNEILSCSKFKVFLKHREAKFRRQRRMDIWLAGRHFVPLMPITKEIDVRVAINSPDSVETPRAIRIDKRLVIRLYARARSFSIELLSWFNERPFNIYTGKLRRIPMN